jgi:nanoRNase/pAp phosphatase (c-di-AMP/oligoRNAs hydrolase)
LEISTRSRGSYDCAAFCTFFKGGGHTKAAGCKLKVESDDPNPFVTIRRMIGQFEARTSDPLFR